MKLSLILLAICIAIYAIRLALHIWRNWNTPVATVGEDPTALIASIALRTRRPVTGHLDADGTLHIEVRGAGSTGAPGPSRMPPPPPGKPSMCDLSKKGSANYEAEEDPEKLSL